MPRVMEARERKRRGRKGRRGGRGRRCGVSCKVERERGV